MSLPLRIFPFLKNKKSIDDLVYGLISIWLETHLSYDEFLNLPIPVVLAIGEKFKEDKNRLNKESNESKNVLLPGVKK